MTRLFREIATACVALALAPSVGAAQLPVEPEHRAVRSAAVDSIFRPWNRADWPGCAVAVDRAGAILHLAGYGMADLERGAVVEPGTVFDLASASKQFTAAAALLLAERGVLSLDDDVRAHLPRVPAYDAPITVRDLVHQTSGLRDYFSLWGLAGRRVDDHVAEAELWSAIARQRGTNFPPGSRHGYSNTNYFLLAEIVEKVAGRPFGRFVEDEIFRPLGMVDTRVLDDHAQIVPRLATSYAEGDDGQLEKRLLKTDIVGHEGVYSTARDLARWNAFLSTGRGRDGARVVAPDFVERLFTPHGRSGFYAFGLRHFDYRGVREISHGGTMGGFRTYFRHYPETGLGVAVLCNQLESSPFRLSRAVAEIYLDDLLEPPRPRPTPDEDEVEDAPPPAAPLELYEGRYHAPELDAHHTVRADGDALAIRPGWSEPVRAEPAGDHRFHAEEGVTWTFHVEDGRVTGATVDSGRARGIELVRVDE